MTIDNKTILILGLLIGGIFSLYLQQENIASAIFGGLVGYLSKDLPQEVLNQFKRDENDEP